MALVILENPVPYEMKNIILPVTEPLIDGINGGFGNYIDLNQARANVLFQSLFD